MFKGHVPKGVGVQVPLRPRGPHLKNITVIEASRILDKVNRGSAFGALTIWETIKEHFLKKWE